ncbi:hypothetical protein ABZ131_20450 [Providencia rettgeri]
MNNNNPHNFRTNFDSLKRRSNPYLVDIHYAEPVHISVICKRIADRVHRVKSPITMRERVRGRTTALVIGGENNGSVIKLTSSVLSHFANGRYLALASKISSLIKHDDAPLNISHYKLVEVVNRLGNYKAYSYCLVEVGLNSIYGEEIKYNQVFL